MQANLPPFGFAVLIQEEGSEGDKLLGNEDLSSLQLKAYGLFVNSNWPWFTYLALIENSEARKKQQSVEMKRLLKRENEKLVQLRMLNRRRLSRGRTKWDAVELAPK